jgi:beta-lactamase class A
MALANYAYLPCAAIWQSSNRGARVLTQKPSALDNELVRLARCAGGVVGVAASRLDGNGASAYVNGCEPFPMASTVKIAVAATALSMVDKGELQLDQMQPINAEDLVPSEPIADFFLYPGLSVSTANLLELMLTHSDNTATDVLMRLVGGARAVDAWLKNQGIDGQRVDRDTAGLLRDFFALPLGPVFKSMTDPTRVGARIAERETRPNPEFDEDVRDTSTPTAMVNLIKQIFSRSSLSDRNTRLLLDIMRRCRTGRDRMKGRLPADVLVAHKTGTIGGTTNDVGLITLPAGRGDVALAIFIKKSDCDVVARERAIADISRAIYDFYLFTN